MYKKWAAVVEDSGDTTTKTQKNMLQLGNTLFWNGGFWRDFF